MTFKIDACTGWRAAKVSNSSGEPFEQAHQKAPLVWPAPDAVLFRLSYPGRRFRMRNIVLLVIVKYEIRPHLFMFGLWCASQASASRTAVDKRFLSDHMPFPFSSIVNVRNNYHRDASVRCLTVIFCSARYLRFWCMLWSTWFGSASGTLHSLQCSSRYLMKYMLH